MTEPLDWSVHTEGSSMSEPFSPAKISVYLRWRQLDLRGCDASWSVMCCVTASSTTTVINVSAIIPSVHACWLLHLGFKTGTCDKKVVAETEITENTTT